MAFLGGFLNFILPPQNPILTLLGKRDKIQHAIDMQRNLNHLLELSGQSDGGALINAIYKENAGHIPYGEHSADVIKNIEERLKTDPQLVSTIRKKLDPYFEGIIENYDKILLADLYRLAVEAEKFTPNLESKVGKERLNEYRDASAAKTTIVDIVRQMAKDLFHEIDFKQWRKEHEKDFLKEKRAIEKNLKRYAKPYIDYLDQKEKELFKIFWEKHEHAFVMAFLIGAQSEAPKGDPIESYLQHFYAWQHEIQSGAHLEATWRKSYDSLKKVLSELDYPMALDYLKTMRGFEDLNRPLLGRYRHLRKQNSVQLEKHLAAAFYPIRGYGYGRSQAYRQSAPQGSIFKLVTAYAALIQRYEALEGKNTTISNLNPLEMVDHNHRKGKELFIGYHINGQPLPRSYKGGRLPRSTHVMGKLDLLKAIENSSNSYFSLLAGDVLKSPEDLTKAAREFAYGVRTGIDLPAEIPGRLPTDLSTNRTGLYAMAIGQHSLVVTPLQAAVMLSSIANGGQIIKPKIALDSPTEVKREIFLPNIIRKILLEGMRRVVIRTQADSIGRLSRFYRDYPEAISDYLDLKDELVGKTSTAEVMENINMDLHYGTNLYKHVWFGGISFKENQGKTILLKDKFGDPELVVVVYLRYGDYGKEAAPLAAQIVQKWREIDKTQLR